MDITEGRAAIYHAAEQLKNWGRWGKDDQIGTLNHIRPEDIVAAAGLIKRGQTFALGIPLDNTGPQSGLFGGRWNPIHTMLATGADAVAGRFDQVPGRNLRYSDDALNMPVQAATHWDSLATSSSTRACTTASTPAASIAAASTSSGSSMPAPRWSAAACCSTWRGIRASTGCPTATASPMPSSTRPPRPRASRSAAATSSSSAPARWSAAGPRALGAAMPAATRPASASRTATGARRRRSPRSAPTPGASRSARTRPPEAQQPWHWVVIPAMGLTMGEMFDLAELGADCAADRVYEFFFSGPPLVITGGTGSPINPLAIK